MARDADSMRDMVDFWNDKLVEYETRFAGKQPLDSDLTAIAALTTTAFGRGLLAQSGSADLRAAALLVPGTDVQAYDADLAAIAALATTSYGRALLTLANQAALRTSVGLLDIRNVTPTNGGTTNVAAGTALEIALDLNHTATIASHTFNLPTLLDGQTVAFNSRAAITAATVNSSQAGAAFPASFTVGGNAKYRWNNTAGYMFRVG